MSTPPPTVIPAGATVAGDLHTPGDALIAGCLTGGLRVAGRLTLQAAGRVEGPVTAAHAALHGHANQSVTVCGRTELFPGAAVRGTLTTGELAAAHGACFEGRLVLSPPAAEAAAAPPASSAGAAPAPAPAPAATATPASTPSPAPTPTPTPTPAPAPGGAALPFVKVPGAATAGLRLRVPAG